MCSCYKFQQVPHPYCSISLLLTHVSINLSYFESKDMQNDMSSESNAYAWHFPFRQQKKSWAQWFFLQSNVFGLISRRSIPDGIVNLSYKSDGNRWLATKELCQFMKQNGCCSNWSITNEDTFTKQYFHKHHSFTYIQAVSNKINTIICITTVGSRSVSTIISTNFDCSQKIYQLSVQIPCTLLQK